MSESGKWSPVPKEAYPLRDIMSKITEARYEIREARPDFPPPSDRALWYVVGSEPEELGRTRHAHIAWEDAGQNIEIESMCLGNTSEWVTSEYGERGLIEALRFDFRDFSAVRATLAEKFPKVDERLRDYEKILFEVSSERGVDLHVRFAGDLGVATFFMGAKLAVRGLEEERLFHRIRRNVRALKEACDRIDNYEKARRNEIGDTVN